MTTADDHPLLKKDSTTAQEPFVSFSNDLLWPEIVPRCDVVDHKGNHCPDRPVHNVTLENGDEVRLCKRCFLNYKNGAYRKRP